MTKSIHSAVLAMENIFQRLYYIEAATALLQGIEQGEIEEIEHITVDFTTLATEALKSVMSGIYDNCEEIQSYLESQGGEQFRNLVENAGRVGFTVSYNEPGRAQS